MIDGGSEGATLVPVTVCAPTARRAATRWVADRNTLRLIGPVNEGEVVDAAAPFGSLRATARANGELSGRAVSPRFSTRSRAAARRRNSRVGTRCSSSAAHSTIS